MALAAPIGNFVRIASASYTPNPMSCYECGGAFKSKAALTAHAIRVHGYKSPASLFAAEDGICVRCLKCFHSRPRLIYHLSHDSPKCLEFCFRFCVRMTDEERKVINKRDAERKRKAKAAGVEIRAATRPAVRVAGPLPKP